MIGTRWQRRGGLARSTPIADIHDELRARPGLLEVALLLPQHDVAKPASVLEKRAKAFR